MYQCHTVALYMDLISVLSAQGVNLCVHRVFSMCLYVYYLMRLHDCGINVCHKL